MASMYEIRLGSQGRLVIPAGLRAELAVEEGSVYVAHVDDTGALVLRTRELALRELQQRWDGVSDASATDQLLAERRREAVAE